MSQLANYAEEALLNHLLRGDQGGTAISQPSTYLALFTADPGETGDLSDEVGAADYGREGVISFDAPTQTGGAGEVVNSNKISFGQATNNWGTITHVAIMDSTVGGSDNMLVYGALDSSKQIQSGDTFEIAAGSLTVTLD